MKGLLRKDLYVFWRHFKWYIFLVVLFLAMAQVSHTGGLFFTSYPLLLLGVLPVSLHMMDEQCKWEAYCATTPCTKAQVVSAKYLIGLLFQGSAVIASMVSGAIGLYVAGTLTAGALLERAVLALILSLGMPVVTMPLTFWLGCAKARITQLVAIGIACGATAALVTLDTAPVLGSIGLPQLLLAAAVVLVLYILSWFLSIRFYKKRDIR